MQIAITGFGGLNQPESGLSVARSLKAALKSKVSIHALGYDQMMTSAWMPGVADYLHVLPEPAKGDAAIYSRIITLHSNFLFDVLIPCSQKDVAVFSRLAPELAKAGIRTLLPDSHQLSRVDLSSFPDFAFDNQMLVPASVYVSNPDSLEQETLRLSFPLTIKNNISKPQVAYNLDQAKVATENLLSEGGGGVLLQQIIYGEEYAATVVAGKQGQLLGHVVTRKLAINDAGEGECGAVVDDPYITEFITDLLGLLHWRGPLELKLVRQVGTTQPWLKEIRCVFPTWIILSHWAEFNLPLLLVQELIDIPVVISKSSARSGALYMHTIAESSVPQKMLTSLERAGSAEGLNPKGLFSINGKLHQAESRVTVAVTGISTFNMVNPGLGVVRALRNAPEISKVYGLNYGSFDSGSFQPDLVDHSFQLPITGNPVDILARITEVHKSHPIDVLIPCLDGELPHFFAIKDQLEALGISMLLPEQKAFEARGKLSLFSGNLDFESDKILMPQSFIAYSLDEIYYAMSQISGPVAIKGTLYGCIKAERPEDAPAAWEMFWNRGEFCVIVQPWVKGEMIAVAAVCDSKSNTLSTLSARKLANCNLGSTWSACRISMPELESTFARFLKKINWVGPAEGEFLYDEESDSYHLLEINPRFTGWISFSVDLGMNHPLLAVYAALGKKMEKRKERDDLIFMRSSYAIEVDPMRLASLSVNGQVNNNG